MSERSSDTTTRYCGTVGGDDAERRRWRRVLLVTGASSWINTATFSTINVGLPDIAKSFPGHSLSAMGWVITTYAIVFGAFLLPAGRIADRFGRRPVYNLGLALFAAGGFVAATAPTFAVLIAGRVVQGAGAAINAPASIGLLLEVTPQSERVRAITLWSALTTIGGASGPTLGALIIENGGWQWAIAGPAVLTIGVYWAGRGHLPQSAPSMSTARLDLIGTVLATASMALLVLAISEGNKWGWGSAATVSAFAGAALSMVLLIARSRRHPEPVVPTKLFRARSFSVGTASSVVLGVMGGSIQLTQALFLRQVWHYPALKAGLAITPAPLFASLASPFAARYGSRYGERAAAIPGTLLMAFSVGWYLWFTTSTPSYWAHLFPGSALNGVGVAFAFPMISAAAVRDVLPADLSIATAVTRAASQVGQALGVALILVLIGNEVADIDRFRSCWWVLCAFCGLAALTTLGLGPPRFNRGVPIEDAH
jgi:EmrB/QacA subfamily drug resistance transporter